MRLSVIIPVYKVENTLNRCIESVLAQNVPDMEVILVDDGSPDNCPQMCDEWSKKDNRIKVIHKPNGGLSDARNAGIDIATGEYITFVDSDDYLEKDTYVPLLKIIEGNNQIDILEFAIRQEDTTRLPLILEDKIFQSAKAYWLSTKGWSHAYVWNKIYNRRLFSKTIFQVNRLFEDLLIQPHLLRQGQQVATSSHGTYVYTSNNNSISKQQTRSTIWQLLKAEVAAAWNMRTLPWQGRELYYYMCCRIIDFIKA